MKKQARAILKKTASLLLVFAMVLGTLSGFMKTEALAASFEFPMKSGDIHVGDTIHTDSEYSCVVQVFLQADKAQAYYTTDDISYLSNYRAKCWNMKQGYYTVTQDDLTFNGRRFRTLRVVGSRYRSESIVYATDEILTVDPTPANFGVSGNTHNYDGTAKTANVSISGAGSLTVKYGSDKAASQINAGSYDIYASVTGGNVYNARTDLLLNQKLTINRIDLQAKDFSYTAPEAPVYDKTAKAAAAALKDSVNGAGTVTFWYKGTELSQAAYESQEAPVNAGTYSVYARATQGLNYNATSGDGVKLGEFTVQPLPVTVVLKEGAAADKVFDLITAAEITAEESSVNDVIEGDTVNVTAVTGDFDTPDVAYSESGKIVAKPVTVTDVTLDNPNYIWDNTQTFVMEATVSPRPLTDKAVHSALYNSSYTWNNDVTFTPELVVTFGINQRSYTLIRRADMAQTDWDYTVSGTSSEKLIDDYRMTVTARRLGNFTGSLTKTWSIEKIATTVSFSGALDKTYDAAAVDALPIARVDRSRELPSFSVTYYAKNGQKYDKLSAAPKDAGEYKAVVTAAATEHYKSAGEEILFTISPKPITVEWDNDEVLTYDGTPRRPYVQVTAGQVCAGDSVDLYPVFSGTDTAGAAYSSVTAPVNAGSYKISVVDLSNGNYCFKNATNEKEFTVEQRELTLKWTGSSFTYNAQPQVPEVEIAKGLVTGDTCTVAVSYEGETAFGPITTDYEDYCVDAGSYKAIPGTLSNANYKLAAKQTKSFYINPFSLNSYNTQALELFFDGFEYEPTMRTEVPGKGKDGTLRKDTDYTAMRDTSASEVGDYMIKVSGINNFSGEATLYWSIRKNVRSINILPAMKTLSAVYDGQAREAVLDTHFSIGTSEALPDEYSYTVEYYRNGQWSKEAPVNAGVYSVRIRVPETEYFMASEAGATITISAKPVTVEWTGAESVTYDGKAHKPAAAAQGVVNGETLALQLNISGDCKDAGTYTAELQDLTNANYVYAAGVVRSQITVIEPKEITVDWTGLMNGEKNWIYDGMKHEPAAAAQGLVSGESLPLTVSLSAEPKDAGTYTATVNAFDNGNYVFAEAAELSRDLVIEPKAVTVKWSGMKNGEKNWTYNGKERALTAKAVGVVEGESLDLTVIYKASVKADQPAKAPVKAGSYKASLKALDNANYVFAESAVLSQSYIIEQKEISLLSWSFDKLLYDGKSHIPAAAAVKGVVAGDDWAPLVKASVKAPKKIGSYTAIAYEPANSDYCIAEAAAEHEFSIYGLKKATLNKIAEVSGKPSLSWAAVQDADGYRVYRSTIGGEFSKIKTVSELSFDNTAAKANTVYQYKICAYRNIEGESALLGDASSVKTYVPQVKSLKAANGGSKVSLSWTAVNGADGYQVYRKANGEDSYSKVATVTDAKWTDSKVEGGVYYSYKVRAFYKGSSTVYGSYSAVEGVTYIGKATNVKAAAVSGGIQISCTLAKGALGVNVYRKAAGESSYTKIAYCHSNTYLDKTAAAGVSYSYKLVSYVGNPTGGYSYSAESSVVTAKR